MALIGEGSFAVVHRYRHRETGTAIAVKKLKRGNRNNGEYQLRLRREVEILEQLRDIDEVVSIIARSESLDGPDVCYAMPVAHANLDRFIQAHNNRLNEDQRTLIFDRVLGAIEAGHTHDILHRDICPSNILVLNEGSCESVVVSDFGLGRRIDSQSHLTRSSASNYGHEYYVAPEQRESLSNATVKSDIFSLGKLLNYVMTGRTPDRHHRCSYSMVIQKAIEWDPVDRYPTVVDLKNHYNRTKEFLRPRARTYTILDFLDANEQENLSWEQLHHAVTHPGREDHIYHSYIDPVIEFFSKSNNLEAYCRAVGAAGVTEFAEKLVDAMRECIGTVGWPFSAMGRFAEFLSALFRVTEEPEAKGHCLVGMWFIAYEADQWGAQSTLKNLLGSGRVDQLEAMILADYISETSLEVDDPDILRSTIPDVVRNAILGTRA